jgi:hypothetical protein
MTAHPQFSILDLTGPAWDPAKLQGQGGLMVYVSSSQTMVNVQQNPKDSPASRLNVPDTRTQLATSLEFDLNLPFMMSNMAGVMSVNDARIGSKDLNNFQVWSQSEVYISTGFGGYGGCIQQFQQCSVDNNSERYYPDASDSSKHGAPNNDTISATGTHGYNMLGPCTYGTTGSFWCSEGHWCRQCRHDFSVCVSTRPQWHWQEHFAAAVDPDAFGRCALLWTGWNDMPHATHKHVR